MPECSKALSGHTCSAIVAQKYHPGKAMPEWHVNYIPEKHSREAACLQQSLGVYAVAVSLSASTGAQSNCRKHLLQHHSNGWTVAEQLPSLSLGLVITLRDTEQKRREQTLPCQYNCLREENGKEHKVCQHTERWEL